MTDNLFDRLADLLRSPGPVNWRLAREIAESVAGPAEPIEPWLLDEYRDLLATAARLVDQATPLDAIAAAVTVGIHDRRGWAAANVESLAYVAEPVAAKLAAGNEGSSPLAMLGPALMGMQVGSTMGSLSRRVLAGFDSDLPAGSPTGASFIVPNIEAFAPEYGLDPRQVRLWVALTEVTHEAVLALPWVRERFHMLVDQLVESLELDPEAIQRRFEALQDPEELQRLMEGPGGVGGIFRGDAEPEARDHLRALTVFIDGYAGHVVEDVGAAMVPQADRVREALDRHRAEPAEGEDMLVEMLGLSREPGDHRMGMAFVADIERRWGSDALVRAWEGPDGIPTLAELTDPVGWAARILI